MDMGKMIRRAVRNQKKKKIQIVEYDLGLQAEGYKIVTRGGFCCPLGAMLLEHQPRPCNNIYKTVELFFSRLGKDKRWLFSFMDGVDGIKFKDQQKRAYQFGKRIRKELQVWR